MLHYVKLLLLHRHQLRTSMTNVAVNVSLGLSDKVRCPQSSLTELRLELCAPPESPVVSQREVEPEGRASSSLELPRGSAIEPLHSALVVPHLLSEATL